MRNSIGLISKFLAIGAVVIPAAVLASDNERDEDALVLKPTSEWSLRKYDDKCRMRRTFGSDEDRSTLWLDRGGTEAVFNVTAIGRPFRSPFGPNLSVQFAPEASYFRNYLTAKSSKGRPTLILFGARLTPTPAETQEMQKYRDEGEDSRNAKKDGEEETVDLGQSAELTDGSDAASPSRIAGISELRLGRALLKPVVFETGPLTEPMAKLEVCAAGLLLKIAKNSIGGTRPVPTDVERWAPIIQKSYPRYLIRANQEASVMVALNIGESGKANLLRDHKGDGTHIL